LRLHWLCCVLFFLSFSVKTEAMDAVSTVDFKRYAGDWYEIALIPYFFENNCVQNARVRYTPLSEGVYEDYFECELKNGKKKVVIGRAKVADRASGAKLSATFLNLLGWRYWFGTNYWIIDLAEDYSYTVVSNPSLKYAWIMARSPQLPQNTLTNIAEKLRKQGVDPCRLRLVPQEGGASEPAPLCEALKSTP
jgi:apolipoprotein D and lipocalin family protein